MKHKSYNLIQVPPLHLNQQVIWDVYFSDKYRAFVINAGRRFGKSTVCLAIAIECAVNMGLKVWWVSPTYKILGNQWRTAKDILKDVYTSKNEVDHRLEFYYTVQDGEETKELKGEITFRSADKPDNLRGDGIHLLIIDEAAFQSYEVYKVLKPATVDTHGNIIFISTPNGHNWFYSFYERGQEVNQKKYPRWYSVTYTSYDNPLLDPKELEDAKNENETDWRIEHMAEFLDDIGKVFSNVMECATEKLWSNPPKLGRYSMGIDLARKHDATVISIIDLDSNKQVALYRYMGKDWALQKSLIISVINKWNPVFCMADATAVGYPVIEDIQLQTHVKIIPHILTLSSKPELIQNLAVKLQNKEITILSNDSEVGKVQINELMAYELRQASKDSTRYIYAAPRSGHDDTVIALALAVKGITGKKRVIKDLPNPFYKELKKNKLESTFKRGTPMRREAHEQQKELLERLGLL